MIQILLILVLSCTTFACSPRVEQPLRNFTLPELRAVPAQVTLSEEVAQGPVLLVFWASWCPACTEEIPQLNKWQESLTPRGLRILGVNVQEPRETVDQFVKDSGIRYRVLLDTDGAVADQYGLIGLPASVFLAKDGKILYYGFSLPNSIESWLS